MVVSCQLMKDGAVLEEEEIPLEANGQDAQYIEQMFTNADMSDFVGVGALHRRPGRGCSPEWPWNSMPATSSLQHCR